MLAKAGMITVLLASASVARGHLEMTIFVRTYPDVGPRGGNYEGAETLEEGCITNDAAVGVSVNETPAMTLSANTRHSIGDVAKTRGFRRSDVFLRKRLSQL